MATTPTGAPKTTGLKYTYRDGEGYGDWYRANTGTEWDGTYLSAKPEGMSDVDWMQGMMIQQIDSQKATAAGQREQTGQALTDIYNQQTARAQESYNSMASQYHTQMKNELEYAGVLHERMKKYLPQQMKAQGMGNMGIAQTAGANAVAKHMSNRNAIIGQNQAAMNELGRTYGERQAALDTEYKTGMLGTDQTYNDTINKLNGQMYQNDMDLFGMTQEEVKAEQDQYYAIGISGIKEAKTREDALAFAEQMKPYVSEAQYQSLVTEANNRGNVLDGITEEETEAGFEQAEQDLLDLIAGATTREEAQAWLDAAIQNGEIPENRRTYLEGKISNKFGVQAQEKASEQLSSLFANGVSSAKLTETLNSMITAGTIPESDRAYWEGLISAKKAAEEEEAAGKVTEQQKQSAAEAESLILQATTAEQRASVLATYQGAVSEAQYRYLQNLVGIADGNQSVEDTQAGQQKAAEQLTSLFAAGASSADIRTTYDQMLTAGTITEADKPYWDSMLSTLENEEREKAEGLISAEQAAQADWARELLGYALDASTRAEILEECGAWLESGKITQSQYDAIAAYAGVLDSNDAFLDAEEDEVQAKEEHDALVDDIIGYIVDVAKNYDEANKYYTDFVSGGEEFSEAEKRSIDIALKMRQNMDDDEALVKMTEEQSKAYDRCVNMMGLYDTVEGQRGVLEKYKDELAPEVYEEFKAVLDVLAEDPETQKAEKEAAREKEAAAKGYGSAAEYDAAVLEGKETITYNLNAYKITGGVIGPDQITELENALKNAGLKDENGRNITRADDTALKDGTVVTISKIDYDKPPSLGSRPGDDFASPLPSGDQIEVSHTYMVYYRGMWYPCEKIGFAYDTSGFN